MGRGTEAEIGHVAPVFLVVARAEGGGAGEVRHLVGLVAARAERGVDALEGRRLVLLADLRESPADERPAEGRALVKGELVARNMVRAELHRRGQAALEGPGCFTRKTEDQVDRDHVEARLPRSFDRPARLVRAMAATQKLEGRRLEGLHPERQRAHAEGAEGGQPRGARILRVRLEGDPRFVRDRQVLPEGRENRRQLLGLEP